MVGCIRFSRTTMTRFSPRSSGRGGSSGSPLERLREALSRATASVRRSDRDRARGRRQAEADDAGTAFVKPVSGRSGKRMSPGCMVGFFGVFLVAGLAFSAVFAVPSFRVLQARGWDPVPCEILESRVATHSGDDGDTYSVEIRYRYEARGTTHEGDRYTFLGSSSSGYDGKRRAVERFPAGSEATCWVNPDDPADSVFRRGFTWTYLIGLFPLVFVAIGGGGVAWALRSWVRQRRSPDGAPERAPEAPPHWLPEPAFEDDGTAPEPAAGAPAPRAATGGPVVLESSAGPAGKFFGVLFLALVWNGIVGVFVWQVWKGWRDGQPDGCLTVFMIPFVLVGLLLIVGIPYQFLALFNPRPRLRLARGRLAVGSSTEVSWGFSGRAGRIRRLRLTLEGTEEARFRRGTDTHTARETFATLVVADVDQPSIVRTGAAELAVPGDTMHSFDGGNNRISWKLKIQGTIRLWPDVLEEFPLVVRPAPTESIDPLTEMRI